MVLAATATSFGSLDLRWVDGVFTHPLAIALPLVQTGTVRQWSQADLKVLAGLVRRS
jgi:hypothetical protein